MFSFVFSPYLTEVQIWMLIFPCPTLNEQGGNGQQNLEPCYSVSNNL